MMPAGYFAHRRMSSIAKMVVNKSASFHIIGLVLFEIRVTG
jgi:hypothetical protein